MFGIFDDKSFNSLEESDILSLFNNNVRESQFLEYKSGLVQPNDLISDICAFANAQGGYLLVGISEKQNDQIGEGFPSDFTDLQEPQNLELIVREKSKDLINPSIFNILTRTIVVNGKKVVVICIPSSQSKPYFIRNSKGSPFPVRVGRSTSYWSMGDVKNQIISNYLTYDRINERINHSLRQNLNESFPSPFLTLLALPVFCSNEMIVVNNPEIKSLLINNDFFIDSNSQPGFSYCFEGIQNVNDRRPLFQYCKIHRDGQIEVAVTNIVIKTDVDRLNYPVIKDYVEKFSILCQKVMKSCQYYDPVTFCIYFKKIIGLKLNMSRKLELDFYDDTRSWDKDCLDIRITFDSAFIPIINDTLLERTLNSFGREFPPKIEPIK